MNALESKGNIPHKFYSEGRMLRLRVHNCFEKICDSRELSIFKNSNRIISCNIWQI